MAKCNKFTYDTRPKYIPYYILYLSYSRGYSILLYTKDQWQRYPLLGWTAIIEKDAKDYLLPPTGNPDFCLSFHIAPKNIINASVDGKTSPKLGCHEKISTWRKMEILVILYQYTSYSTVYVSRPGRGQKTQKGIKMKNTSSWKNCKLSPIWVC